MLHPGCIPHAVEAFDCGDAALNRFLIRFALANQRVRASRTYVALAVDHQGQGLGAALLKDAIGRTLAAAAIAGIRALAVHAKDEGARGFCEHFGFRPSPSDPLHLFVPLKDLQGMSAGSTS